MPRDTRCFIQWRVLKDFVAAIFARLGVAAEDADIAADVIVRTSLRGIDSHGIFLFPAYVKRLKLNLIEPRPEIRVVQESGAAIVIDGGNGLGQVVGCRAMKTCVERCRSTGMALATVCRSNHFGAADYYALLPLWENMIGVAASNGAAVMAPWGAGKPYLGTNPISVAVPCGKAHPVVVDIATSVTARSKIIQAQQKGKKIPGGWAIDAEGTPTRDPQSALTGAMLPAAGRKGSGLALVIEILSSILSGGAFGPYVRGLHEDFSGPQGTCHFFAAIDIGRFLPVPDFASRMEWMAEEINRLPPARGTQQVIMPGEERAKAEAERALGGIPLERNFVQRLNSLGDEYGVRLTL